MYSGVNDENNQGAFNDENSLYHYSYSKDREPQPGQPDPSQTSWQPASRSEDPVSPEEPVAYTTGTRQDDPQPPKPEKGSFWKKTGTKVTALVLCCALTGGLCGFGGASLARRGGKATIQESGRTASAVSVKSVDGQTLMTPAEVYASTVNSVVSINCSAVSTNIFGQRVQSASSGSGFVITQDGYIVTNQHVVSGASSVNVTLYNGDTYPATVVGGDSDYDVAVLKIEATGLQAVTLGKSHILFEVGDTELICRRLEGEFLAYRNAIPRNNPIHVECDARTLLASIDRVSLIISEKLKSPLRCVFGDGLVSITTKTGIGDAADQCPITGDGQELEIGFNNKYLMDALKAAPADRLRLEFSSGVAPCVILPAEGEENFIYMVLPVRLKAN